MCRPELTADQKAESERIYVALQQAAASDLRTLAEVLAATPDEKLFGKNEFDVRDLVHKIGATALKTALEGRKKGGTKEAAVLARSAREQKSFSVGRGNPS